MLRQGAAKCQNVADDIITQQSQFTLFVESLVLSKFDYLLADVLLPNG